MPDQPRRLGPTPTVHHSTQLQDVTFGVYNEVGENCTLEHVNFGDYSYCGPSCIIQNAAIGKFSNVAAGVRIGPTRHPIERASLHHFTYRCLLYGLAETDDEELFAWRREQRADIGHDTWLGHGAVIMPGVTVGLGAVVGAAAVVTKDVPSYAVAVGNPARVMRDRFPAQVADALRAIAWWHWPHEKLAAALDDFRQPVEAFIEKHAGVEA